MATDGIVAPKQERSRESFARVRTATVELLAQRASTDFTLQEVSALAGVSIGSIYGRIGGKADLLSEVQREEFERIDGELTTQLDAVGGEAREQSLEDLIAAIVAAQYESLKANASLLTAFMVASSHFTDLVDRGQRSFLTARSAFVHALARALAKHHSSASTEALEWCFEVTYSVTTRRLGIGLAPGAMPADAHADGMVIASLARTIMEYVRAS